MTERRAEYNTEDDLVQYNAPDFGVIPAELMCDQRLSRSARLLGCLLWSYRNKDTGVAWPSQKVLAARLGVSERSIRNYMIELRAKGWMVSQHRISVDASYHGNPGALIHTLNWSPNVLSIKGKPEATFRSDRKQASPTTGSSTSQEHTKEHTKLTVGGGRAQSISKTETPTNKNISKAEKALLDAQIYARTIKRLVRDYSEEVILEKAKYWREGKLVRAIEEDWQPGNKEDPARRYNQGQFADFWDA